MYLLKQCLKKSFSLLVISGGFYCAKAQTDPLYYTPGENLTKKTAKYLFIKVETNKKEALAGESIIALYQLYVAVDIQGKLSKSPSFTGFASYDMEGADADTYTVKNISGISYRVYQVKKVQLFGLRPGIQRLEPVELEATIRYRQMPLENNDVLFPSATSDTIIHYTLKSSPVEINIKRLPADNTGTFSGAVGDFEFSALAAKNTLSTQKADTLHWVLKGNGNWHEVILPSIKWPAGVEVFEPIETDKLNPFAIPVQGLRTIGYPVVFNKKGSYLIEPVSFTFYNPVLRQYKTIKSDSIRIEVTESQNSKPADIMDKQSNLTALFSRYTIIVFPVAASILLGLLFFKRKNT